MLNNYLDKYVITVKLIANMATNPAINLIDVLSIICIYHYNTKTTLSSGFCKL